MVKFNWALAAAVAAQGAIATTDKLSLLLNVLKRQEPGSAAYSCHAACGQAILAARASEDVCSNDDFLTNYDTCLKCSGPDNIDIWKIYGGTLSGFGKSCGLSTTPVSGGSTGAGSASTVPVVSVTSSVISITSAPTETITTPGDASATSAVSTPATNGTTTTTGVVPVNAADALSVKAYGLYAAGALVALYIVVH
ncbi:hypothetical protein F4801DRAFT_581807 [Xylaria longipes]|nr:hypothetical protein F4801DRAFT_581807 [Xylaria longipes]